jgi:NSS family neurotransmitter:Na+ symporter
MASIPSSKRDSFSSKFGVIAAAAGSAIGLGNIWRFPYVTGENGGAAFLLIYLAFVTLVGIPVMMSEFVIGRSAQKNAVGSFKRLAPRKPWFLVGMMGVAGAFVILAFYAVVAGWTLSYLFDSARYLVQPGKYGFGEMSTEQLRHFFQEGYDSFLTGTWKPVLTFLAMMGLTVAIVLSGVRDGIEKYAKILMPILLAILLVLVARGVTLEGAREGVQFLFKPDFSQITGNTVLVALGQAFFSLSVGMGTLITYGSYIQKRDNLANTAVSVAFADTFIAVIAGLAIFPAVFAFGISPDSGQGLVYITLPVIFQKMAFGSFWALLFFLLLCLAALTSTISVLEVVVAYFSEELGMNRKRATLIAGSSIGLLGLVVSMSWGPLANVTFGDLNIFELFDASPAYFLPLGGFFIVIFVGWFYGRNNSKKELSSEGRYSIRYYPIFIFLVRYLAPIAIALVFLNVIGLIRF